jgi:uncharacterized membrane protein
LIYLLLALLNGLGILTLNTTLMLRIASAGLFLFTGLSHWSKIRPELVKMVPPAFPNPEFLVTLTGVLEIAGAIGLLWHYTMKIAATGLVLLLVVMFPANVYAAQQGVTLLGKRVMKVPTRLLLQILFAIPLLYVAIAG